MSFFIIGIGVGMILSLVCAWWLMLRKGAPMILEERWWAETADRWEDARRWHLGERTR